jgi:hypothetical protein
MKEATKNVIEDILVSGLGGMIPHNEIINSIDIMSSVDFDSSAKIDEQKLQDALNKGTKYLSTIAKPVQIEAMNSIYQQQVVYTFHEIAKALV